MAIFARLVLMLFSIVFLAAVFGRFGMEAKNDVVIMLGFLVGGAGGIFMGRFLGDIVAGPPPKP